MNDPTDTEIEAAIEVMKMPTNSHHGILCRAVVALRRQLANERALHELTQTSHKGWNNRAITAEAALADCKTVNRQLIDQEVGQAMDCAAHEAAAVAAFRAAVCAELRRHAYDPQTDSNAADSLRLAALRIASPDFGARTLAVVEAEESAGAEPYEDCLAFDRCQAEPCKRPEEHPHIKKLCDASYGRGLLIGTREMDKASKRKLQRLESELCEWHEKFDSLSGDCLQLHDALAHVQAVCERGDDLTKTEVLGEMAELAAKAIQAVDEWQPTPINWEREAMTSLEGIKHRDTAIGLLRAGLERARKELETSPSHGSYKALTVINATLATVSV